MNKHLLMESGRCLNKLTNPLGVFLFTDSTEEPWLHACVAVIARRRGLRIK